MEIAFKTLAEIWLKPFFIFDNHPPHKWDGNEFPLLPLALANGAVYHEIQALAKILNVRPF